MKPIEFRVMAFEKLIDILDSYYTTDSEEPVRITKDEDGWTITIGEPKK